MEGAPNPQRMTREELLRAELAEASRSWEVERRRADTMSDMVERLHAELGDLRQCVASRQAQADVPRLRAELAEMREALERQAASEASAVEALAREALECEALARDAVRLARELRESTGRPQGPGSSEGALGAHGAAQKASETLREGLREGLRAEVCPGPEAERMAGCGAAAAFGGRGSFPPDR